jgi:hypothetical protein
MSMSDRRGKVRDNLEEWQHSDRIKRVCARDTACSGLSRAAREQSLILSLSAQSGPSPRIPIQDRVGS